MTELDPADPLAPLVEASYRWNLLTAAEEVALAKRIERGDLAARERLLSSNIRLVVSTARRYTGRGREHADLVQDGMLGLIRASEKFDWRLGYRFSTYATIWIRQTIQRGLENDSRTIRIPVYMSQRVRTIARAERELSLTLGREPSVAELAEAAEMTVDEVLQARAANSPPASLDGVVGGDLSEITLGDVLASDGPTPEESVLDAWREQAVAAAVEALPESERQVIELRFGQRGDERTLDQAARAIGHSRERARRLEERALRRLARNAELSELREAG